MIGDRIKDFRINKGLSINKLAHLLKISPGNLSDIEKNKNTPSTKAVIRISEYMDKSIDWILTGKEREIYEQYSCDCQLLKINAEISAGEPAETYDEPLDFIYIDKKVINNINNYYIFKVNGQSMEPGIVHQDVVIIKKNSNWANSDNQISAVRVDGEITLKRIIHGHEHKRLVLISDNRCFEPIIVDPSHSKIALLGFLHYLIREVK